MTLPKLRKLTAQVEQFLSGDTITPRQLSHEIKRISPRIKTLKNEIDDILKSIPKNINAIFEDIKTQAEVISKDVSQQTEKDMILAEIYKMKGKMQLKVDNLKSARSKIVCDRLMELSQSSKEWIKENEGEKEFNKELEEIEKMIEANEMRVSKRLTQSEKLLADISIKSHDDTGKRNLAKALDDGMEIKTKIVSLNSKISSLELQMKELNMISDSESQKPEEISEIRSPLDGLPDLGMKLSDLKDDILASQLDQSNEIDKMEKQITECEKRIDENEKEAKNLQETAAALMVSIGESQKRAKELADLVKETASSFINEDEKREVKSLYAQFAAQQSVLRNDLESLSKRLHQASFDIPLLYRFQ